MWYLIIEIVKLAKGDSEAQNSQQLFRITQCEQEHYEMHVRAANIVIKSLIYCRNFLSDIFFTQVRAGESLMKLISDIKQYLILNDFPSVNDAIASNSKLFRTKQQECDHKLMTLRDDMAADLYDLEEEYYSSLYK
jgi:mediator of RNA polymerase II transcription subunit 22